MEIYIRKTNHIEEKKGKQSQCLYVNNNKDEIKRVILTGDKKLIADNDHLDELHTLIHYIDIGKGIYFERINPKNWITYYNRYINPMNSIQIEMSNIMKTSQLIFEDNSISYNIENININGKEFYIVNLKEYDINLYLPITTQIQCREIKNDI